MSKMKSSDLAPEFRRRFVSAVVDVRKQYAGCYKVTAHGLWYTVAVSEDGDGWYIGSESVEAHNALGSPERSPHFRRLKDALAHLEGLK